MDGLDVSLSAVIPQLYTNGPLHSHPDRPGYLVQGDNQLLSLLRTAAGVEDGPDIQWDLRMRWGGQGGQDTNQRHSLDPEHGIVLARHTEASQLVKTQNPMDGCWQQTFVRSNKCGGILHNGDVV